MASHAGAVIVPLAVGFLIGIVSTIALALAALIALDALWPQWRVVWSMAGATQRVLWIVVPSIALYAALAISLWKGHRTVALGVLLFAVTDFVLAVAQYLG